MCLLGESQLLLLQWENVDFKNTILTIIGETAKSTKTRHIPLNSIALKLLKNWRNDNNVSIGLVFLNDKTGAPFTDVKKAWLGILKKAKIAKFRWHDMRHHFASKLVMASVDLNTVRELLGHADIKMTLRYAHLAPEHKATAVLRNWCLLNNFEKFECCINHLTNKPRLASL
jgi:integrase